MANIKSAQKRAKQEQVRRKINLARKTAMKTAIRKVLVAVENGENPAHVQELLRAAEAKIARARGKGLIHKNAASRKISRLTKRAAVISK
jgi:small subunit ribosomal protein S20